MTELSDELLVAYVDGQLARKQTLAVDKVLEHDDVIAKRVVALKHAHRRLEAAFDAVLAGEEATSAPAPHARGLFISWSALAQGSLATAGIAFSVALLLAGFGWPLSVPEFGSAPGAADPEIVGSITPGWQEEVARAQALIGRDTLEVGLDSQGNPDLVAFQLTQAIGAELILPELDPRGFKFVRAQLLRFEDAPLAQFLYLGAGGAPLALYAKKNEGESPPTFNRYGDIGGVGWTQGGVAYLLAGEQSESDLRSLADVISKKEMAPADDAAPERAPPLPKQKPKT
jgi:anti-sigma factor RsiW